jgi:hypothetical protein
MNDPYDFLDPYDELFDREVEDTLKVFDDPLANDPLTALENSIERPGGLHPPSPILTELETSIEASLIPPTFPDPDFNAPEIPEPPVYDETLIMGYSSPEPPTGLEGSSHRVPANPFKPRLYHPKGRTVPSQAFIPSLTKKRLPSNPGKTPRLKRMGRYMFCPVTENVISLTTCLLDCKCWDWDKRDCTYNSEEKEKEEEGEEKEEGDRE